MWIFYWIKQVIHHWKALLMVLQKMLLFWGFISDPNVNRLGFVIVFVSEYRMNSKFNLMDEEYKITLEITGKHSLTVS